jgi:non-homologous end joining protein Ku
MRPYWKGYLKLALVSCPIALHAACSTAERIAFRQINKATGNRLRQQLIDEETREPVAPEHKGRGYEVAKGQYLIVEDAELDTIEIESTHTIEIDSFVPRAQIDQRGIPISLDHCHRKSDNRFWRIRGMRRSTANGIEPTAAQRSTRTFADTGCGAPDANAPVGHPGPET